MTTKGKTMSVWRDVIRSNFYVLVWMLVSCSVIIFNKWLLAISGFHFPIALTMWHMAFCSCTGFLLVRVLGVIRSHNLTMAEYMRRVMPIGILYAASLWLSNASYLYLSVGFIQMTKSLMPGLVYASGLMLGIERWNTSVAGTMVLIAFGVLVCAYGEENLHSIGLASQLSALCFEALRLALVQVLINKQGLTMNPFQSIYYVSPSCFLALLVPFFVVELPRLRAAAAEGSLAMLDSHHLHIFVLNACAALTLNLTVFLLIGKTSALTMNVAGVIKDWSLIFVSASVFGAPVTLISLEGYAFCCTGVAVYNYLKLRALKETAKQDKRTSI